MADTPEAVAERRRQAAVMLASDSPTVRSQGRALMETAEESDADIYAALTGGEG
jgi:hypothetical protein